MLDFLCTFIIKLFQYISVLAEGPVYLRTCNVALTYTTECSHNLNSITCMKGSGRGLSSCKSSASEEEDDTMGTLNKQVCTEYKLKTQIM